ncbi:MAG: hypothetical protein WAW23_11470 [Candidatus Methanoperedens sp.]
MKEFEDALLDIGWNNLDSEKNRFKDIDTKAIGIITITGILMTFLAKPENLGNISSFLFVLTALSFLSTILLCVRVIRIRLADALSTNYLIEDLKNMEPKLQIRGIVKTIANAELSLGMACTSKAEELKYAIYALCASIILLIAYTLSTSSLIKSIFHLLFVEIVQL